MTNSDLFINNIYLYVPVELRSFYGTMECAVPYNFKVINTIYCLTSEPKSLFFASCIFEISSIEADTENLKWNWIIFQLKGYYVKLYGLKALYGWLNEFEETLV